MGIHDLKKIVRSVSIQTVFEIRVLVTMIGIHINEVQCLHNVYYIPTSLLKDRKVLEHLLQVAEM